ncbi:MAG: hypothetical protein V7782_16700, partial [Psychromonas sp.]
MRLIWGDLLHELCDNSASVSNDWRDATEVSRRHSSETGDMKPIVREGQNINQGGADMISDVAQPVT